jgi:hypothetical protein
MRLRSILVTAATICGLSLSLSSCDAKDGGFKTIHPNAKGIEYADFNVVKLSDDVLLGEVYRLKVADDLIFVSDNDDRLYSFNMDGSLHAQYGMKGRAGNEYLYLSSFYIDEAADQVCIIDDTQGKMLYYSYDGKFVKAQGCEAFNQKARPYDVYPISDGRFFVHNHVFNDQRVLFLTADTDGGAIEPVRSVQFKTPGILDMCGEHLLSVYDGKISYIAPFDPVVYSFENGKEVKRMEIEGVKTLSQNEQAAIDDYDFFKAYNYYNDGYFVGFTGMFETGSFILFNEMTNLNYLIIDKNTGLQKRFEYSCDEDLKNLPILYIKGAYKDWYVGLVSASLLTGYYSDYLPSGSSDPFIGKLRNTIKGLKEDSNPCVLLYKIKSVK